MNFVRKFFVHKKLLILAIVVIGIASIFLISRNGKQTESEKVSKGEVKEELVLSGELVSGNHAKLSFQSSGLISWVNVVEGQFVKKGTALMALDTQNLNSTLQRARSDLRSAEATVAKVHDDLKGKGNSETFAEKEERTTAEVAKDKAYEAMLQAQKALKDATLIAPFDGFVTNLVANSRGMNATVGVTQVEIVNPTNLYLSVNADQTEVGNFKVGTKGNIIFDAFENQEIEGTVTSISFSPVDSEVGSVYELRLSLNLDNDDNKFKVGMSADVRFTLKQTNNVLYVTPKFVKTEKDKKYVKTENGKNKVYIEVGIEGEDRTEIKGNIKEGDLVFN